MPQKAGRVLIVDDEEMIRSLLVESLTDEGYSAQGFESVAEAFEILQSEWIDVVVSDIHMPGESGLQLLARIRERDPNLPVILITANADIESAQSAVRNGAYDYITKPFDITNLFFCIDRALERRRLLQETMDYQLNLERRVQSQTEELKRAFTNLTEAHTETIFLLSRVAEFYDEDTGLHIRRISEYTRILSRELGLDSEYIQEIAQCSPLHDIGKVTIPVEILRKPGPLTEPEWEVMKKHTTRGAEILEGVPFLRMAREIALSHHEKFDGNGYPERLAGEEIPLSARIVAVADVFDALTSRRCYKDAIGAEDAGRIILEHSGGHFDPHIVPRFEKRLDSFKAVRFRLGV